MPELTALQQQSLSSSTPSSLSSNNNKMAMANNHKLFVAAQSNREEKTDWTFIQTRSTATGARNCYQNGGGFGDLYFATNQQQSLINNNYHNQKVNYNKPPTVTSSIDNKTLLTGSVPPRILRDKFVPSGVGKMSQRPRDCPPPSPLSHRTDQSSRPLPPPPPLPASSLKPTLKQNNNKQKQPPVIAAILNRPVLFAYEAPGAKMEPCEYANDALMTPIRSNHQPYIVRIRITSDSEDDERPPVKKAGIVRQTGRQVNEKYIQCGAAFSDFRNVGSQIPSANNSPSKSCFQQQQQPFFINAQRPKTADLGPVVIKINDLELMMAKHLDTPSSSSTMSSSPRQGGAPAVSSMPQPMNLKDNNRVPATNNVTQPPSKRPLAPSSSWSAISQLQPQISLSFGDIKVGSVSPEKLTVRRKSLPSPKATPQCPPPSYDGREILRKRSPHHKSDQAIASSFKPNIETIVLKPVKQPTNEKATPLEMANQMNGSNNNTKLKSKLERLRNKCSEIETLLRDRANELGSTRRGRSHSADYGESVKREMRISDVVERSPLGKSPSLSVVSERETAGTVCEKTPPLSRPISVAETPSFPATAKEEVATQVVGNGSCSDDALTPNDTPVTFETLSIEIPRSRSESIAETEPIAVINNVVIDRKNCNGHHQLNDEGQLLIQATEVQNMPGIAAVRQRERSNFYMDVYGTAPPPNAVNGNGIAQPAFMNGHRQTTHYGQPVAIRRNPNDLVEEIRQRRRNELLNIDRISMRENGAVNGNGSSAVIATNNRYSGYSNRRDNLRPSIILNYHQRLLNQNRLGNNKVPTESSPLASGSSSGSGDSATNKVKTEKPQSVTSSTSGSSSNQESFVPAVSSHATPITVIESRPNFTSVEKEATASQVPVGTLIEDLKKVSVQQPMRVGVLVEESQSSLQTSQQQQNAAEDDDGYFSRRREIMTSSTVGTGTFFSKLYFTTTGNEQKTDNNGQKPDWYVATTSTTGQTIPLLDTTEQPQRRNSIGSNNTNNNRQQGELVTPDSNNNGGYQTTPATDNNGTSSHFVPMDQQWL